MFIYVKNIVKSVLVLLVLFVSTNVVAGPLKITLVINGVLGDKSFFDSAQRGVDKAMDEYDVDVNTIELGIDPNNWETGLDDAMAGGNYDILIAGTWQMIGFMASRVHKYPDKTFMFFDASMPYEDKNICKKGCENVYSITYNQNEGSFLAGVYAGAMTLTNNVGINKNPTIGAVGGQDIPVINDFIVGYEQGACLVNKSSKILIQYAGSWNDPARGKEITLALYEQGADIVFQIAGGTGEGVFEAAAEQGKYALGVDSDQATIILENDPQQAKRILTSMMKNVDNSLYRGIGLYLDGKLPIGKREGLGIAEGGVGLAYNEIYFENTPNNIQSLIKAVEKAVINNDIKVNTYLGDNAVKVGMSCNRMKGMNFNTKKYLK